MFNWGAFFMDLKRDELINKLLDSLPSIRKDLSLSQTDLGSLIGVSRQTISSIERRGSPLSWSNYLAILYLISTYDDKIIKKYSDVFDGIDEVLLENKNR